MGGAQKAAAAAAGAGALAVEVDVAVQASAREARQRFSRIDFLVNYAGVWDPAGIEEIDDARWARVLDVNLKGSFFM